MDPSSQAINRLLVAGLACNLTRVYSHLWSGARSDSTYPTSGAHHAFAAVARTIRGRGLLWDSRALAGDDAQSSGALTHLSR